MLEHEKKMFIRKKVSIFMNVNFVATTFRSIVIAKNIRIYILYNERVYSINFVIIATCEDTESIRQKFAI